MSEETAGAESAPEGPGAGVDPAAMALSLGSASRAKAEAYLESQRRLCDLQIARLKAQDTHFHEEAELELSHLRLRRFSGYAKAAFEFSVGLLALALVGALGIMVWNAAHADGLIVESFNVPADLAARGLGGQVIAGQLTDKLSDLQAQTDSNRAPKSYSNDWGDDIKVEIPETGVSIGEAYRFLRRWLGHETRVSGDVWRTPSGLVIAARVNGGGGAIAGTEADLDGLIQKAAEDIYSRTQPYRYAVYLARHGRNADAEDLQRKLAATADANERAWANFALAAGQVDRGSPAEQEHLLELAAPRGPALALGNLALLEEWLGRPEMARSYFEQANARMREGGGDINPDNRNAIATYYVVTLQRYHSDYRALLPAMEKWAEQGPRTFVSPYYLLAQTQLLDHDRAAARKSLQSVAESGSRQPGAEIRVRLETQMAMAGAAEDWASARSIGETMHTALRDYPGAAALIQTADDPQTAIAEAKLGHFAEAERRVAPMPADCYPCLVAHAQVADMRGQSARADWWFARAVQAAPSMPLAYEQWGRALLVRGKPDDVIAKFKTANQKAPHFSDPLEGWGEALMAKNQSHLALAKFTEAEKYAPNWGRLHLKWGEALLYSGKPAEAKAQFTRAAALDLTPSEKAELTRMPHV